jgi:hypothetical protein
MVISYHPEISSLSISFLDTEDEHIDTYDHSLYFSPDATIDYDKYDVPIGFEIIGEEAITKIKQLLEGNKGQVRINPEDDASYICVREYNNAMYVERIVDGAIGVIYTPIWKTWPILDSTSEND